MFLLDNFIVTFLSPVAEPTDDVGDDHNYDQKGQGRSHRNGNDLVVRHILATLEGGCRGERFGSEADGWRREEKGEEDRWGAGVRQNK